MRDMFKYSAMITALLIVLTNFGCSFLDDRGNPDDPESDNYRGEYSAPKNITGFTILGVSGTIGTNTITLTVPYGTSKTSLTPTITHTGASVSPLSVTVVNFTNTVNYTVTAADSSVKVYVVTVSVAVPPSDYTSANIGTLKVVPAGTFQRDATSTNTSTVSAFRMSEKEITRAQFTVITGLTDPSNTSYSTGTSDPVQQVNWYHALVFCNKLSMLEGLTPVYTISGSTNPSSWGAVPTSSNATWDAATANWSANGYRLPTEMEWMWAAMGATGGTTGYLKAFAGSTGSNAVSDYAWTAEKSSSTTHPTGTKLPNELGLYDMSGNVWEWCWDWSHTYPTGAVTNYPGTASGANRVGRGGCWYFNASYATVAGRYDFNSYYQHVAIGFRVVRT